MNSALDEQLSQIVSKTLEDLTFLFTTPESWEMPNYSGDEKLVSVRFMGHFEGDLIFVCPPSVGREMTVNMLGLDDDEGVAEAQIQDALKEVINIICGNILPILAGADAVFNIMAPEILSFNSENNFGRPAAPVAQVKLDLEGESGYLFLFLDDPAVIGP